MIEPSKPRFAHRPLPDGSVDSVCLMCFRTIATTEDMMHREFLELTHMCTELELYELQLLARSVRNNETMATFVS